MSEAEKQKSHKRIVDAASRLMRERGIEATSVSDVMKAAGLTHGGFYRHFDSKEALVSEAFLHAVGEVVGDIEDETTPEGKARGKDAYIEKYLSRDHLENRAQGCPLAALGAEIARQDGSARPEASQAVARMADLLVPKHPHDSARGIAIMALLLGTITLARLAETPKGSASILEAGKRGCDLLEQHW